MVDLVLQPDAQPYPRHHHRREHQAGAEVVPVELAEQRVGNQLDRIGQQEEHVHRGDVADLLQLLRQQVHQDRRAAGVGDEAGEAGDAGQHHALAHRRPGRLCRRAGNHGIEQHEADGDRTDQQADEALAEQAEGQAADQHAQQGAGQHDLQVARIPLAVETPQPGDVRHAQDRQHDRRGLGRRHRQRHQRHGDPTQRAAETTLGNPGEQHGGQGDKKKLEGHKELAMTRWRTL
ncbi:hypothetical protein D9M68_756700 [compost metagenome]